ncbi:hypothetical protein ACFV29_11640 [Streptomyces sp. NPDC059690]|uniref:hypothetical protein n=1 Tax=Streptomyces sp. NPDC059690 TaxID=3346907 RepID=UPI0036988329
MSNTEEQRPAYKDARFWLAVGIVALFALLTWSVYEKADTFTDALRLWDSIAVIFSALVGGLLGFTVNYKRATQAEETVKKSTAEATIAKNGVAALLPIVERVIQLEKKRASDADSATILQGAKYLGTPPNEATATVEGESLTGKTLHIAGVDPELSLLADQAKQVLGEVRRASSIRARP